MILKEISPEYSLEGTDVEAETPILWPPDVKSWLLWKDPDAGKDWGQEEKGITEDEMFGWHHQLNGHWFGWTLGVGDGQGGLACCNSWGHKESDTTERLNWTELKWYFLKSINSLIIKAFPVLLLCIFYHLLRIWIAWSLLPCFHLTQKVSFKKWTS